ncbi:MAG: polysaccharide deacetylase family protein [Candidatus Uhrbacteria bacterium]|nr:polysaccharide deacetylase family protein [Candidatus Uhrbacteria bacterium]
MLRSRKTIRSLLSSAYERVSILLYHRIAPSATPGGLRVISPDLFEEQLRILKKDYHVISLETYVRAHVHGFDALEQKTGKHYVVITFDDGYQDNYQFAFPLLKKYNLPATFYVSTGFVENPNMRCPDDANMHHETFLSWKEIQEMAEHPLVQIGAHTVSHPRLTNVPIDQAAEEIHRSKVILEQQLGKPITTFAYPFGTALDVNRELSERVRQLGFTSAMTTMHGMNNALSNVFRLRRIEAAFDRKNFVMRLGYFHTIWYGSLYVIWLRVLKNPMRVIQKRFPNIYRGMKGFFKM